MGNRQALGFVARRDQGLPSAPFQSLEELQGSLPSRKARPQTIPSKKEEHSIPMDKTQPSYSAFVGFDVSKETVTAYHSRTGQTVDIENTPAAIGRYLRHLDQHCLAICEPPS